MSDSNGALVLSLKHNKGSETQMVLPNDTDKQSISTDKSMKQPLTTTTTKDKSLIASNQPSCLSQTPSKPSHSSTRNTTVQLAQPKSLVKPVTKSLSPLKSRVKSPVTSNTRNQSVLSLSSLENSGPSFEMDSDLSKPMISIPKLRIPTPKTVIQSLPTSKTSIPMATTSRPIYGILQMLQVQQTLPLIPNSIHYNVLSAT